MFDGWSQTAADLVESGAMRAHVVAREHHGVLARWMSKKSIRVWLTLSSLLAISITVNGLIILLSAKP